ncbi:MAG TPA: type I phosphomannose isomerase catalytic subunit [Bryobacteraceae bacterium]|nr:type I phosphomannose isomerase catalytic subunit [Bryobacteraceae bacterium]
MIDAPVQLLPLLRERPWGREDLAPYFESNGKRIGEVWFTCDENPTSLGMPLGDLIRRNPDVLGEACHASHPGICPLLVKFLFTTERLSVQVHPDDEYAERHHHSLGKTEAWYVVDSREPGELAVGFREMLTRERLRESALSGEIEQLLDWRKVKPGDVVFTPAGTVHAIGAGLTICEIQENSDITYRLYDYGRPRELHLEHGVAVSHLGPHHHNVTPKPLADWRDELVASTYFRIERLRPKKAFRIRGGLPYYLLLICLRGQVWLIPAHASEVAMDGLGAEWILTYTADRALSAEMLEAAERS